MYTCIILIVIDMHNALSIKPMVAMLYAIHRTSIGQQLIQIVIPLTYKRDEKLYIFIFVIHSMKYCVIWRAIVCACREVFINIDRYHQHCFDGEKRLPLIKFTRCPRYLFTD